VPDGCDIRELPDGGQEFVLDDPVLAHIQVDVACWLTFGVIDVVIAQNDAMAIGVRKAFQEMIAEIDRDRWLEIPFTGVDGAPKTGQAWVRSGLLAATVFTPPNAGTAMELFVDAIKHGKMPTERVLIAPSSVPTLEKLRARR